MNAQHSSGRVSCPECVNFTIHPDYPYLVICLEKQQLAPLPKEVCKDYVEKTWEKLIEMLSERGFLYCSECKKPIYSLDELNNHKKEFISLEFFPDEVASEESPAAD
ncbi:MAG: hypothetical protein QXP57_04090 [Nitrososphaerota archaeon]